MSQLEDRTKERSTKDEAVRPAAVARQGQGAGPRPRLTERGRFKRVTAFNHRPPTSSGALASLAYHIINF